MQTAGDYEAAVPLDTLELWPGNPRAHRTQAQVRESLQAHGQYQPLVVQRASRRVVAGNGLLQAMRLEGYTHGAVRWLDVDDVQARRILAVDNATADGSGYDDAQLAVLLQELAAEPQGLTGTGYQEQDLEDLLLLVGPASTVEELEARHGTSHDPAIVWPELRLRLPPPVHNRWLRLAERTREAEPADAFAILLRWAEKGRKA